jgi:predicted metal-binding protein
MDINNLIREALELKATHAAIVDVAEIRFDEGFRALCEKNTCGSYNKNWMCPPAVGLISDLRARVLEFKQGLLLQTVHELKNSFDWKGMMSAGAEHTVIFRNILRAIEEKYAIHKLLPLNAGPCTFCAKCAFLDGEPCRFPEQALFSVEACGIDVIALEKSCEMPYYNGKNTVSYVGLILFQVDE